jgi:hypothetical protein
VTLAVGYQLSSVGYNADIRKELLSNNIEKRINFYRKGKAVFPLNKQTS